MKENCQNSRHNKMKCYIVGNEIQNHDMWWVNKLVVWGLKQNWYVFTGLYKNVTFEAGINLQLLSHQVFIKLSSINCRRRYTNLENSAFFLMTSFKVASTAAIVSSDVPWSCCGFPDGNFCTRSRIAYFPKQEIFSIWYIHLRGSHLTEKLACLKYADKK